MTGLKNCNTLIIKTGNVLNLNDILKRPGQQPTDELLECLKIALSQPSKTFEKNVCIINGKESVYTDGINPEELLITVKVFVNSASKDLLRNALDNCIDYLDSPKIGSLVLAYQPKITNDELRLLWNTLEEYAECGKIARIGVSDLETEAFIELYNWAKVKPSIVQISLAGCCIVPPQLKDFAKDNEVQLLTHNDPGDLLPQERLKELIPEITRDDWFVCRFQGHIKCRGVLATKGYLVGINLA